MDVLRLIEKDKLSRDLFGRAAVTGMFDPDELAADLIDQTATEDYSYLSTLNALARHCNETKLDDNPVWILKDEPRREILSATTASDLERFLSGALEAKPSDVFGSYLRKSLLNQKIPITKLSDDDLAAYRRALQFSSLVYKDQMEEAQKIQVRVAKLYAEDALRAVKPEKLFGRDEEYDDLLNFVRTGKPSGKNIDDALVSDESIVPPFKVPCFLVTGVGGSGKSALVSTFIYNFRRWPANPPIILLDFDRPILTNNNVVDLTFELTRQLGMLDRKLDRELSAFRADVRNFQRVSGYDDESAFEHWQLTHENSMSLLAGIIVGNNLDQVAITLVLDTFEEMLVRGEPLVAPVFKWLDDLKYVAGLDQLRVIIAGRSAPNPKWNEVEQRFIDHLAIEDLDTCAATQMLMANQVPKNIAKGFTKAFGGNPLVLKMLERLYREKGDEEVQALLASVDKNERRPSGEIAQRFLYERILNRIDDAQVKVLAHPGLVLRRVTVDLIENVLQTALRLDDQGTFDAQDLYERLARHVWLVRAGPVNSVEHRRDLRRLILRGILDEKPDVVRAINEAAISYYESYKDPVLSNHLQEFEAAYHRCLMGTVPDFDAETMAMFLDRLGEDIVDFKPDIRGRLRVKAEEFEAMAEDEFTALEGEEFVLAARHTQMALNKVGVSSLSSALSAQILEAEAHDALLAQQFDASIFSDGMIETVDAGLDSEDITAAFNTCDFERLARHSPGIFRSFEDYLRNEGDKFKRKAFMFSDWWKAALAIRAHVQGNILEKLQSLRGFADFALDYATDLPRPALEPYEPYQPVSRLGVLVAIAECLEMDEVCEAAQSVLRENHLFLEEQLRSETEKRLQDILISSPVFADDYVPRPVTFGLTRHLSPEFFSLASAMRESKANWAVRYMDFMEETAEHSLSDINKLAAELNSDLIDCNQHLGDHKIDGFLPEIHAPINHALNSAAFEIGPRLADAMKPVKSAVVIWPIEFDAFTHDEKYRFERWSTSLIMHCDRSGCLSTLLEDTFLKNVPEASDAARLVDKAARLVRRYEELLGERAFAVAR